MLGLEDDEEYGGLGDDEEEEDEGEEEETPSGRPVLRAAVALRTRRRARVLTIAALRARRRARMIVRLGLRARMRARLLQKAGHSQMRARPRDSIREHGLRAAWKQLLSLVIGKAQLFAYVLP